MNLNVIENRKNTKPVEKLGYSIEEISEMTTLSKAFLRQKIREGILKATHFGRRVIVLSDDLNLFLKNGVK